MKIINNSSLPDNLVHHLVAWVKARTPGCWKYFRVLEVGHMPENHARDKARWDVAWEERKARVLFNVDPLDYPSEHPQFGNISCQLEELCACLLHVAAFADKKQAEVYYRGTQRFNPWDFYKLFTVRFQPHAQDLHQQWINTPLPEPKPPREKKPPKSAVERRAEQAARNLAKWQTRLKLATTKVKKYRQKARYYEKKQGAQP